MDDPHMTDEVASRLESLASRDNYLATLGIQLLQAGPQRVVIGMKVMDQHMNFNGTCHGGVLFSLADTAFGLASNAPGLLAAAVHADIAFCAPVRSGAELIAEAVEISRSKRVGTYRVDIHCGNRLVAAFTGTVHVTDKPHCV
ncbi:MAG: hotdog fold thioesterase [Arenicellales bacterium]